MPRRSSTPSNICSAGRRRRSCENFRGYKGAQSYPSRTKDTDDVDFSTGSVGLGVAQTLFSSLVQDYVRAHGWGLDRARRPHGRAGRRRRTRRGQHLRGDARRLEAGPAQLLVDHRLQPAEPRCGRARRAVGALRTLVQEFRLGRGDPEIRLAAAGGVPRTGRRAPAPMDRRLPEPALFGAVVPGRRVMAQAAARRHRRPGRGYTADRWREPTKSWRG